MINVELLEAEAIVTCGRDSVTRILQSGCVEVKASYVARQADKSCGDQQNFAEAAAQFEQLHPAQILARRKKPTVNRLSTAACKARRRRS